jgi:ubiquinone/menaquinone biosynthesis C-methylase UbiE
MDIRLNDWAKSVLADPITKATKEPEEFRLVAGVIDARVFLPNTYGYSEWSDGQVAFESLEEATHYSRKPIEFFKNEIENDRPVYQHFDLQEPILDVGGSAGLLREFLSPGTKYLVVDPFINVRERISKKRGEAYRCLSEPLNFVSGLAEFLPIQTGSFQTVHMRSMLDHVQIVDLCLLEARRVLKPGGQLLVGISIEGRPFGQLGIDLRPKVLIKNSLKSILARIGFDRYRDEHVWHPTFENLRKVIIDAGFTIEDIYWQPAWQGKVVYIGARVKTALEVC